MVNLAIFLQSDFIFFALNMSKIPCGVSVFNYFDFDLTYSSIKLVLVVLIIVPVLHWYCRCFVFLIIILVCYWTSCAILIWHYTHSCLRVLFWNSSGTRMDSLAHHPGGRGRKLATWACCDSIRGGRTMTKRRHTWNVHTHGVCQAPQTYVADALIKPNFVSVTTSIFVRRPRSLPG